jgi:hypothetical protein
MSGKHTPGDWSAVRTASPEYAPQFGIYAEDVKTPLAIVLGENGGANSELIAAAPELLAKLESMVAVFNQPEIDPLVAFLAIEQARAAIRKARGQA